jgi:signal transduction histidine kinase
LNDAKSGKVINYQLFREINGTVKWFDLSFSGIKDDKNEDFGYILTIRDITRQKKLEIERDKITSDLIQRNKALEQFTYIISHNLRAPVANIMGLSSLINGVDIENEEITEITKGIGKSARKLDEVISDLNQVLQVNEDINENIELILLPNLIDDIKFSIRHLVEKENVQVHCDFAEASEILSIKSFIHSIFYNLILNSIKYRNPGTEPVITIGTTVTSGKMRISYKDNGRGIDTNKYGAELFGLYKRFDTSVEGKGMGLFMVKMQVESLGGTISLKSELQHGTEFVLEFPQMHLQIA